MNVANTRNWFIQQLGAPTAKAATKLLDDSLADNWGERSSDKYQSAIQVFPDSDVGWDKLYDGRKFNIGQVVGSSGVFVLRAPVSPLRLSSWYISTRYSQARAGIQKTLL